LRIFVDESGLFVPGRTADTHSISVVAALIFSESGYARFLKKYGERKGLRSKLPKSDGEVKGRDLNETQTRSVAKLLRECGALLEIVAVDRAFSKEEDVITHKNIQAEKLVENLTPDHKDELKRDLEARKRQLKEMSNQLYVQSVALSELVYEVLNNANTYFAFREPKELASYSWVLDSKSDDGVTSWEDWWSTLVGGIVQSKSIRKPMLHVIEGDYSYQDKFVREPPEYLVKQAGIKLDPKSSFVDLSPVLRSDFRFSSKPEYGLEVVDIMANAVRRGLRGNLKDFGWNEIPKLMIQRPGGCIKYIQVGPHEVEFEGLPYEEFALQFMRGGRLLVPED